MTSIHTTTKPPKSGKSGIQKAQTLVLPGSERPFIADLQNATRLKINFLGVYNVLYQCVLGNNVIGLMDLYGLDHTDPDAWQQIRGRIATENPMGFVFVRMAEEMIRQRVIHAPLTTHDSILRCVTTYSIYAGTQCAQACANIQIEPSTGEFIREYADGAEDDEDE